MGYPVSDLYGNKIYKEDSIQTIDILANDKKIECIRKLEYKDDIFETDNFTLGSAISSEIKLEIDNDILNEVGDFDEVSIQTNLLIDEENDVYESVPIGSYIVKTKDTSTKEYTKLTLYDYMDKLNVEFDASNIVPCTRYQLLKEICDYCGLILHNETIINGDLMVDVYDNTILAKTYVSFIAERAGGFAKVIRDELYIKCFGELEEHILPNEIIGEYINNNIKTITKIVYENGIQKFEQGTDDGEIIYLSQESPFSCTQEEINNIYEKLNGLQFQSLDVKVWGNPAIDTGDKIILNSINSFAQKNWTWGNGFYGSYKTTLNKIDKISNVSKVSNSAKIKKLQSTIDEEAGKISTLIKDVDDISEKQTEFKQTIDGFDMSISDTKKELETQNGTIQTLEGTIKEMNFNFSTKGLSVGTSTDSNNSLLDNTGIRVYNYEKLNAIFNNKGSGIDKLIVTGTAQLGYLKVIKSTKNGKKVTKFFHLKELIEDLTDLEVE